MQTKRARATTFAISQILGNSRAIIRSGKLRADWTPFSKRLLRRNANSWRRPRRNKPRKAKLLDDVRMKANTCSAEKSTAMKKQKALAAEDLLSTDDVPYGNW